MAELEAQNKSVQQLRRLQLLTELADFNKLTVPQLTVRENYSENAWNRFAANNLRLTTAAQTAEEKQVHQNLMDDTEQVYLQVRDRIRERIHTINEQNNENEIVQEEQSNENERNSELNDDEQSIDENTDRNSGEN